MAQKPVIRQCVGCRSRREKSEMLRVVRTPEGNVSIDTDHKQAGRGAYICPQMSCFKEAVKKNRLHRALKTRVRRELVEKLEKEIGQLQDDM